MREEGSFRQMADTEKIQDLHCSSTEKTPGRVSSKSSAFNFFRWKNHSLERGSCWLLSLEELVEAAFLSSSKWRHYCYQSLKDDEKSLGCCVFSTNCWKLRTTNQYLWVWFLKRDGLLYQKTSSITIVWATFLPWLHSLAKQEVKNSLHEVFLCEFKVNFAKID